MSTIITRLGKGSSLTWAEADANFTNLNTDKLESSALTPYLTSATAASTYETQTHASSTYETQSHASSTYLAKASNLSDITNATTARTNLGLGTAAIQASSAFATSGAITSNGNTMSTSKLLGRTTASTGSIEEITVGTGLSLSAGTLTASGTLTEGSAQSTVSVTSIDFTSIPSTVKRITILLYAISTNGTSLPTIRIGAGSVQTTGYAGTVTVSGAGSNSGQFSTGFDLNTTTSAGAARALSGNMILTRISNTWLISGSLGAQDTALTIVIGGSVTLSGTLDRLRLTTQNGTDQFDNGAINIYYE